MKTCKLMPILLLGASLMLGCSKKEDSDMASPYCVKLETETDPVARAELEKRCPRGGPKFRPSQDRKW